MIAIDTSVLIDLLGFSLGEWVSEQVRAGSRAVMGEAAAGLR